MGSVLEKNNSSNRGPRKGSRKRRKLHQSRKRPLPVKLGKEAVTTATHATLLLSDIKINPALQIRASFSEETIEEYKNSILDGAEFPPIDVFYDGNEYFNANGFHRYEAHIRAGKKEVAVNIHQGGLREALLFAIGSDIAVGLPRSNLDKRRAVELLLNDKEWGQWSAKKISHHAGVSDRFVSKMREELSANGSLIAKEIKCERGGSEYVMSASRKIQAETDDEIDSAKYDETKSADAFEGESEHSQVDSPQKEDAPSITDAKLSRVPSKLEEKIFEVNDKLDELSSRDKVKIPDSYIVAAVDNLNRIAVAFLKKFHLEESPRPQAGDSILRATSDRAAQ